MLNTDTEIQVMYMQYSKYGMRPSCLLYETDTYICMSQIIWLIALVLQAHNRPMGITRIQENNILELANQSTCCISYKHKPYNNNKLYYLSFPLFFKGFSKLLLILPSYAWILKWIIWKMQLVCKSVSSSSLQYYCKSNV